MKALYLSGPIRGVKNGNRDAFHAYAAELRGQGFKVFSPIEKEIELDDQPDEELFLRRAFYEDCKFICLQSDVVAMMPRWRQSKGCLCEHALAEAIGIDILYLKPLKPITHLPLVEPKRPIACI